MRLRLFICSCLVFLATYSFAQIDPIVNDSAVYISINKQRIASQKNAMYVLGAWSVGNILYGSYRMNQTQNSPDYFFHQTNVLWNSINISIATFGVISAIKEIPSADPILTLKKFHQTEQAFLFNTGLDLAYVASGLYLTELGRNRNSEQIIGIGNSVMLQGGFLFAFDLFKYFTVRNKTQGIYRLMQGMQFRPNGVGWRRTF